VREQQSLFDATEVLIEDKASGTQLIQELIADGCHGVTRYQPTTDKTMRLNAQTAIIENGFVYIPETAPWLAEYLHEITVFPNGKHDDQVDSTAQFLDWFKRPYPGQGIFRVLPKNGRKIEAAGAGLCPPQGAARDRRRPDAVGPTHHDRRGSHRRDVRRRCQLLDPRRLDQARRMKLRRSRLTCRDVNRPSPRRFGSAGNKERLFGLNSAEGQPAFNPVRSATAVKAAAALNCDRSLRLSLPPGGPGVRIRYPPPARLSQQCPPAQPALDPVWSGGTQQYEPAAVADQEQAGRGDLVDLPSPPKRDAGSVRRTIAIPFGIVPPGVDAARRDDIYPDVVRRKFRGEPASQTDQRHLGC
jgi:hypothetical protein